VAITHRDPRYQARASSRSEIVEKLRLKYPEQIGEAEKKFHEFFRDIRNLSFF